MLFSCRPSRLPTAFLYACLCGAAYAGTVTGAEDKPGRFAVLVGVTEYQQKRQFSPLEFTENDVNALSAVLRLYGYEVTVLTNTLGKKDPKFSPTKANIERALKATLDKCREKTDLAVVGLSGHGVQFLDKPGDGSGSFFCPVDGDINKPETLVCLSTIYDQMTSARGTKFLLVDACRNDPNDRSGGPPKGIHPDRAPPPAGVGAMFSCSAGQKAFELRDLGHGVFFYYVLEGLRREVRDERTGDVSWNSLNTYVCKRVEEKIGEVGRGARQKPTFMSGEIPETSLLRLDNLPAELPANSVGAKLVKVPAGRFRMGSPEGERGRLKDEILHDVVFHRPFYMGAHEVTQGEFEKVMGYNPSYFSKTGLGRDLIKGDTGRNPVEMVTRAEAEEFCRRLSALPQEWALGRVYRLPSEAEWEYACREAGKAAGPFSFGGSLTPEQANFRGVRSRGENYLRRPAEVGTYKPNALGLYDMHGNVAEWCADPFGPYEPEVGRGTKTGPAEPFFVLRGGSWFDHAIHCRSANRMREGADRYLPVAGFRVVWAPGETSH